MIDIGECLLLFIFFRGAFDDCIALGRNLGVWDQTYRLCLALHASAEDGLIAMVDYSYNTYFLFVYMVSFHC